MNDREHSTLPTQTLIELKGSEYKKNSIQIELRVLWYMYNVSVALKEPHLIAQLSTVIAEKDKLTMIDVYKCLENEKTVPFAKML